MIEIFYKFLNIKTYKNIFTSKNKRQNNTLSKPSTVLSTLPEQPLFLCFPNSLVPQYVIDIKQKSFRHCYKNISSKSFSIVSETEEQAIIKGKTQKDLEWKVIMKKKGGIFTADIIIGIHTFYDRIVYVNIYKHELP